MLLGHDLLVDWLKLGNLVDQGVLVSRDCEFLGEESLHLREPVLGSSTLLGELSAFLVHVLELGQSVVELLLAVVELPLHLAHLALDLRL